MLAPYIIIIVVGLFLTCLFNALFSGLTLLTCLILTMLNFILVLGVDIVIALSIHALPIKWFSPYKKIFNVKKAEVKFYEKIKIRKWKSYVADLGGIGNFSKKKLQGTESEYLLRFLQEGCCGEIIHYFCVIAGVSNLLFINHWFLNFSLPIISVNAFLNLLPIFIQRYNRPKFLFVYEKKKEKEVKNLTN